MERQPNTQYVLSLSYGKDSMACIDAIKQLGWPLDRIVTAEVWATDTIQADLPPMVEFKDYADRVILERYGIQVEHYCAMRNVSSQNVHVEREREREQEESGNGEESHSRKKTYESIFYHVLTKGKFVGNIKGFPKTRGSWCKHLKEDAVAASRKADIREAILPCSEPQEAAERERERERTTDSRKSRGTGATTSSGDRSRCLFRQRQRWTGR